MSNKYIYIVIYIAAQDICYSATNGEWKLPKHVILSMALRHMYRSSELTTIFNRLGHCDNYSFSVELETALANSTNKASTLLTSRVALNPPPSSVFHSDFDNFDKNTAGASIHTSHGIMLQEIGSLVAAEETADVLHEDIRYHSPSRITRTKCR